MTDREIIKRLEDKALEEMAEFSAKKSNKRLAAWIEIAQELKINWVTVRNARAPKSKGLGGSTSRLLRQFAQRKGVV